MISHKIPPIFKIGILFLVITSYSAQAQEIQWASKLEYQFNQFSEGDYSGEKVVGAPDAGIGEMSPNAFRINSETEFGTIVCEFDEPIIPAKIIVIENNEPGRITEIDVIDEALNRHTIYKSLPIKHPSSNRALVVKTPKLENKIIQIEININTIPEPGWSQVDAIGITKIPDLDVVTEALHKYEDYLVEEVIAFVSDRENLGEGINTTFVENKPVISPDGKELYFTRENHPDNVKGEKDPQDIYVTRFENGSWSDPSNMGEPLNDKFPNGVSSVSPDGNSLLLINTYKNKRGDNSGNASISTRTKEGWSYPEVINIDDYYNEGPYEDYQIASNGKILIQAIQRGDTEGDQDLYISFKEEEQWSVPINLGPTLNTDKAEFSPFLAPDGKTLYFSSEGHGGFGNSDIFFAKRLDDSWLNWSEPVNIGPAVNTSDMDAYYTTSAAGDYAYFVSTNGGIGGSRDIFRIKLPEEFRPEPVLLVKGRVLNLKTNEPVEANIFFQSISEQFDEGEASSNPSTGEYNLVLTTGINYSMYAEAKGYLAVDEYFDLTEFHEYTEVEKDLYLLPLEEGQTVTLNSVFFESGSTILKPESYSGLERLVLFLNDNPELQFEIGSFTETAGQVSEQRAGEIKNYLVGRGINESRISVKGYTNNDEKIQLKIIKI